MCAATADRGHQELHKPLLWTSVPVMTFLALGSVQEGIPGSLPQALRVGFTDRVNRSRVLERA
jgi:hypothetical protein